MSETSELEKMLAFLREIGISVIEREINEKTFVPGLALGPGCIYMDKAKMLYPGDLLHEAGHLAVTAADQRKLIGSDLIDKEWPSDGEEIGAILWSYAALTHIGIRPETVFHPHGYKQDSEWLIENFSEGTYVGLPFLEWIGVALGEKRAEAEGKPAFPKMLKWMRD